MDNIDKFGEIELTVAEKLAQLEKEKFSRRQALVRFGFQAGAAAVAALTADELLRKVGKEMRRRAGDSRVAQQVAKELQQAGVANAVPLDIDEIGITVNPCDPGPGHNTCLCCGKQKEAALNACKYIDCAGLTGPQCEVKREICRTEARMTYAECCTNNHCNCG